MKKLWLACLCAVTLVCLSTGVALAQGEGETSVAFCGELSEEECAALEATTEVMAGLTSGTTRTETEFYMTGAAFGDSRLSLRMSTEGTFVVEPETLARLFALKSMSSEELMADPTAISEMMLLPFYMDTAQTRTIEFSPELMAFLAERFSIDVPAEISFQTRLVDGIMYARPADYTVFGTQPAWMPEWIGLQMMGFLSESIAMSAASAEFNVEEAQESIVAPGAELATGIVYHVPPEQMALYEDFMHLTLQKTTQYEGQEVNVYRITWDIPRYLGGPLFAQQSGLLATQGHPNPTSRLLGLFSTVLLSELHTEATQTIGVENSYLYEVETQVEWVLGMAGGPLLADSPVIGITSTTTNHDLNAVTSIDVPAGAAILPIDTILQTLKLLQR